MYRIPPASRGARLEYVQSSLCEASWEPLGGLLGPLEGFRGPLGGLIRGFLGPQRGFLGRPRALLRRWAPSEAVLGASRGRLGAVWGSS